jgi:tRNA pseudouridine13 synthase
MTGDWLRGLPRSVSGLAVVEATLKASPEDFIVEEVPAYLPSGQGEHWFLKVRKRELNTADVMRRLAMAFGVDISVVGSAGLKDKQAVTTQWLSVHLPGWQERESQVRDGLEEVQRALKGLEILEAKPHDNKLKTGHLKGNAFRLVVRGVRWAEGGWDGLAAAGDQIAKHGFLNYFGAQRFGGDRDNVGRGLRKLSGGRIHDRKDRLMVSAVQSAVFNLYAASRARRGELCRVFEGDVLKRVETGGEFVCTDPVVDQRRLDEGELVVTGPLPGLKARQALGQPLAWEHEAMAEVGLTRAHLVAAKRAAQGDRRPLMVRPEAFEVARTGEDTLSLSFVLPAGSYATMLLYDLLGLDGDAAEAAAAAEVAAAEAVAAGDAALSFAALGAHGVATPASSADGNGADDADDAAGH